MVSAGSETAESPGTHHDRIEVLAAFRALSEAEMKRLTGYARYRMVPVRGRLHDADAEDLFHEALVKTLEGTRPWRRGVPFVHHLLGCMSSITNNWFEQGERNSPLPEDVQGSARGVDSAVDADIQIE